MARYRPSAFELSRGRRDRRGAARGPAEVGPAEAVRVLLARLPGDRRADDPCARAVPRRLGGGGSPGRGRAARSGGRGGRRRPASRSGWRRGWRRWRVALGEDFDPELRRRGGRRPRPAGVICTPSWPSWASSHDPKLELLLELLENSPARKIAVFATFGATVRYLDENLPELVGGRERVVVIGGETTPDERTAALGRFAPDTVVHPDYEPPDGEVDLLLSTDVLSEGQNLQQAQAVISYDMPWNPQRVVQRNGRVIRLPQSPRRGLPDDDAARSRASSSACSGSRRRSRPRSRPPRRLRDGVGGDRGASRRSCANFAERLAAGDDELLDEAEQESGAFIGEELRRLIDRAIARGRGSRGSGACRGGSAPASARPRRAARAARRESSSRRGHRRCPARATATGTGATSSSSGRRARARTTSRSCAGSTRPAVSRSQTRRGRRPRRGVAAAAADIVDEHNARADLRDEQEPIGAAPALGAGPPARSQRRPAEPRARRGGTDALSVERSSAVRRALGRSRPASTTPRSPATRPRPRSSPSSRPSACAGSSRCLFRRRSPPTTSAWCVGWRC